MTTSAANAPLIGVVGSQNVYSSLADKLEAYAQQKRQNRQIAQRDNDDSRTSSSSSILFETKGQEVLASKWQTNFKQKNILANSTMCAFETTLSFKET